MLARPAISQAAAAMVMAAIMLGGCASMPDEKPSQHGHDHLTIAEIRSLWDFNDPAGSEQRFADRLSAISTEAKPEDADLHTDRAILLTQLARTHSLRRQFDQAHALLDEARPLLTDSQPIATVYFLLERGRTFNSSRHTSRAREDFMQAWQLSRAANIEALAVDAAHMIAIVESGDDALHWNKAALALAESSNDPDTRRWRGSLHNNIGWTYHAQGDDERALKHFELALTARIESDQQSEVPIARWCIARCLRSLSRIEDALAMQRQLAADALANGAEPDGYIEEELAECLSALGRAAEARPHFRRAHELLSQDTWLAEQAPERLARLKQRAGE